MYALVADCACGQGQDEIRRSVLRRGWCPKLSSQLKRDHKSVTHRGRHQVGQVDIELPTHPLPEAQQRQPLTVPGEKLVERADYVSHCADRVVYRVQQTAHENASGYAHEHV
jgi:hypothetical protein